MDAKDLEVGKLYQFINQQHSLVYVGCNWGSNGYWHQFELEGEEGVWSELKGDQIDLIVPVSESNLCHLNSMEPKRKVLAGGPSRTTLVKSLAVSFKSYREKGPSVQYANDPFILSKMQGKRRVY